MKQTTFIFVRHAESKKNLREVTGGGGEGLTVRGYEQVKMLAVQISSCVSTDNCEIISSNMIQAEQTALLLADLLEVPIKVTKNLQPADMGIINGLTKQEMMIKYPAIYEQLNQWRNCEIEACELTIPGMEPPDVFWERTLQYLRSICMGGVKVVVCTRSVLVLIYNFIHKKNPKLGGGYKHIHIDNCEFMSFLLDKEGEPVKVLKDLNLDGMKSNG